MTTASARETAFNQDQLIAESPDLARFSRNEIKADESSGSSTGSVNPDLLYEDLEEFTNALRDNGKKKLAKRVNKFIKTLKAKEEKLLEKEVRANMYEYVCGYN